MTEFEDLRDKILEEAKHGRVVLMTSEGLMAMPLDDLIDQPADGILYDLNRDLATVLTYIEDPKWVNDHAVGLVIRRLKEMLEAK